MTGFQRQAGIPPETVSSLTLLDARQVARAGLEGLRKGKTLVVPGILNRVLTTVARVAPKRLMRNATFKVQAKRLKAKS